MRCASQRSHPLGRVVLFAPSSPYLWSPRCHSKRTNGLHTKVLCPVSEQPYRRLDGTRAPHGMARSPRRPAPNSSLPAESIPSVLQHCLVDCTQRSSTLWGKARLMKHIARVKYGGILAVAYDERRRLLIDRTIRKWRNSALRYPAVSMWRYDFLNPCGSAEAFGASAAEHSPRGCSTCASDTGSARCELWFHVVDSNRMQAQSCLRRSNHVLCGRLR